jgi:hypothetical protein
MMGSKLYSVTFSHQPGQSQEDEKSDAGVMKARKDASNYSRVAHIIPSNDFSHLKYFWCELKFPRMPGVHACRRNHVHCRTRRRQGISSSITFGRIFMMERSRYYLKEKANAVLVIQSKCDWAVPVPRVYSMCAVCVCIGVGVAHVPLWHGRAHAMRVGLGACTNNMPCSNAL